MPKHFTLADTQPFAGTIGLYAETSDFVSAPMWYHKRGLQQTASGYGSCLNSGLKVWFEGKLRRIYVTCFSNAGTSWFNYKGQKVIVR